MTVLNINTTRDDIQAQPLEECNFRFVSHHMSDTAALLAALSVLEYDRTVTAVMIHVAGNRIVKIYRRRRLFGNACFEYQEWDQASGLKTTWQRL